MSPCEQSLVDARTVMMPYQGMFWGADYGMLVDKFGIGSIL